MAHKVILKFKIIDTYINTKNPYYLVQYYSVFYKQGYINI